MLALLGLLAVHLVMTGLPIVVAMLIASRHGVRSPAVLVVIGLAAGGTLAMLDFWLFYATPTIGKACGFASLSGCAAYLCFVVASGGVDGALLRELAVPIGLWCLGSGFLVFLGFVHGGLTDPLGTGATRFTSWTLPSDNDIPAFYMGWFYAHGHHGTPPVFPGGWTMSDRPPLQVGYELLQRTWGTDSTGLNYQVVGVILQQQWILGLWALLVAAGVGRITRGLTLIVVLVSGLALVNGFFVWPKLLPAAMLLGAAALIITPTWVDARRQLGAAVLIGALFALSMLGHGSSIYAILGLAVAAALRVRPHPRWLLALVLSAAVLYVPWSEYQKYGDPPGNRLTRWFFAGDANVQGPSTLSALEHDYGHASLGTTAHNKALNFAAIGGGAFAVAAVRASVSDLAHGHLTQAADALKPTAFYNFVSALGFLLLAPFMLALARWRRRIRGDDWRFVTSGAVFVLAGTVLWGLIQWGGEVALTVLHQGSYALPLITMAVAVAAMRAAYPRIAVFVCVLNVALSLLMYGPALTPATGTSYEPLAVIVAAATLGGFCLLALGARIGSRAPSGPRTMTTTTVVA